MFVYQNKFIRIAEFWGDENPIFANNVDLVRCFQREKPVAKAQCREMYTILIDLSATPENLLAKMKKDTRYEIRRALTNDNFVYQFWDCCRPDLLTQFCDLYDEFASERNLKKINRRWISSLAENSALNISQTSEAFSNYVSWHIYNKKGNRVTLLHSVALFRSSPKSIDRNRMGRANRFHHWQDMLKFKDKEIPTYDLGGWYNGKKNLQLLKINKFKEEFGGTVVKNYVCEQALTLRGKLFLQIRKLLLGNGL